MAIGPVNLRLNRVPLWVMVPVISRFRSAAGQELLQADDVETVSFQSPVMSAIGPDVLRVTSRTV